MQRSPAQRYGRSLRRASNAARVAMSAVQRVFASHQRTFLLPCSVHTLSSAREHGLLMKAAFGNLQLKVACYQPI